MQLISSSLTGHMTAQVATLRSAVKLDHEQHFQIAKKLQELTGSKNIKLKPVIDEELIAGFVVEYGSSQVRGADTPTHSVVHSRPRDLLGHVRIL